jgi:4'-phosphopantetheinyl transferase
MEFSAVERPPVHALLPLLAPRKQEKIRGFTDGRRAAQDLYGELLVRGLACSMLDIPNSELSFVAGPHGKPYLSGYPEFHFNLSHSGSRVICVVDTQPVGVDIERQRPIDLAVARLWFSADEQACLMVTCPEKRLELFYILWTLKESYAKAVGLGLALDPKSFTVLPDEENSATVLTAYPDPARFFRTYRLDGGYRAAVCADGDRFPDQVRQIDLDTLLKWLGFHNPQQKAY